MTKKINKKLQLIKESKEVLVAVHRGSSTGNIIENTIKSSICAMKMGADIIEVDVIKSTDGVFYAFHNGMELRMFGEKLDILSLSSKDIEKLEYVNTNLKSTGYGVEKLENLLPYLKGEIIINIDRSWNYLEEIIEFVKNYNMQDQIIIKTPVVDKYLKILSKYKDDVMYMPIVRKLSEIQTVLSSDTNLVAIELIFANEDSEVIQEDVINDLKSRGILLWCNAIIVSADNILSGGYDDDISILEGCEKGWGVLIDKGFDIIQTDWPTLLNEYILKNKGGLK